MTHEGRLASRFGAAVARAAAVALIAMAGAGALSGKPVVGQEVQDPLAALSVQLTAHTEPLGQVSLQSDWSLQAMLHVPLVHVKSHL